MTEAFEKFRSWKKARTFVKLSVLTKRDGPQTLFGVITAIDEQALLVSFMIRVPRSFRTFDLRGAAFELGAQAVIAEWQGGSHIKFEVVSPNESSAGVQ